MNTGDKFFSQSWEVMRKQEGAGKKVLLVYSTLNSMDTLIHLRPKYHFYDGDISSGALTEDKENYKGLKFKNNTTLLKDVVERLRDKVKGVDNIKTKAINLTSRGWR